MSAPYSLYKRKNGIYYVQFWDNELQKYGKARSTRCTNYYQAVSRVKEMLLHPGNVPSFATELIQKVRGHKRNTDDKEMILVALTTALEWTLKQEEPFREQVAKILAESVTRLAKERGIRFIDYLLEFWDWERSPYVKRKLSEGHRIGEAYVNLQYRMVKRYAVPFFGDKTIQEITPKLLEDFKTFLLEQGHQYAYLGERLNKQTANRVLQAVGVALREAERLELIPSNPMKKVSKLSEAPKTRGIFSSEEIRALFRDSSSWRDYRSYVACLLSAVTGMRSGEVLGLQKESVFPTHVLVQHSWDRLTNKLKSTKTGKVREAPIPPHVYQHLKRLMDSDPWGEDHPFVFYSAVADKPVDHKVVEKDFNLALRMIGITEEDQDRRRLCFHSFRHTFNSLLLSELSAEKTRLIVGHSTAEMTEHYTHLTAEDRGKVIDFTQRLIAG